MKKTLLLSAIAAFALAVASPAKADTVLFNPVGNGDSGTFIPIVGVDWYPGNGLAVGASANTTVGTQFQFYYQAFASANCGIGGCESSANQAVGGHYFTVAVRIAEVVTDSDASPNGIGTLTFGLVNDPNNFFRIYASTTAPDNTTGVCFVCGDLVYAGTPQVAGYTSSFTTTQALDITPAHPDAALDQAGASNSYPGVATIRGSGETSMNVLTTFVNTNYLRALLPGSVVNFNTLDANADVAFDTVNPAACLLATAMSGSLTSPTCTGGFVGVGTVGNINGLSGPNTILEVDGNTAFQAGPAGVVPEPATLSLLGLGLLGAAVARRRQLRRRD